ncbi:MAG: SMP-30/gluconolactonase/LRE family protein, partial [Pseudomonadota bacterium]|nr:SMP-30/gluconolactonase/LRE family protein [Pseudomonadota bacterium]
MTAVRRIGTQRDVLGESPIWSTAEQALYWVDIRHPALRRLDDATGAVETREMPAMVGAIAFAAIPRHLVVALAERIVLYDWETGRLATVAELPQPIPGHRFNDGRCDRAGRFWVGTMHNITRAAEGTLFRLDPAGLTPILSGVSIPNSLAWSPDGRVMYFADSLRHAIARYHYDPESGTLGPASLLVATAPPGFPDGSTVDAEGCLWNAEFNGGRVVRYTPNGAVDRVIPMPVDRPTACAFGGPGLERLYITT